MSLEFTMRLADVDILVRPLHDQTRAFCEGYLTGADGSSSVEAAPALTVEVTPELIEAERALSTEGEWSDAYLERLAIYRKIAEWGPAHGIVLMHGAVIEWEGRAYMFCAASGTGKSTHIRLWRTHLGPGVKVVNGDKPLVRVGAEGEPLVYGTPWCGKEGWQRNVARPLAGICFIERAAGPGESSIRALQPLEALERAMRQIYLPEDEAAGGATLEALDKLLTRVPLHLLAADMTEDAVRVSFTGLTGERYPGSARADA